MSFLAWMAIGLLIALPLGRIGFKRYSKGRRERFISTTFRNKAVPSEASFLAVVFILIGALAWPVTLVASAIYFIITIGNDE